MGMETKFDVEYEPIRITDQENREDVVQCVREFLVHLSATCKIKSNNGPLWTFEEMTRKDFFLGSFGHVADSEIETLDLVRSLPEIGDIDVCAPASRKEDIVHALYWMSQKIPHYCVDYKVSSSYVFVICLIITKTGEFKIHKIDIALVKGEENKVSDFAKKYRSSDWVDRKFGIKAMYARFLLQAVLNLNTVGGVLKDKTGKVIRENPPEYTISYMGLRKKYEAKLNGEVAEIKDKSYSTSDKEIFKLAFKRDMVDKWSPFSKGMWSVAGILNEIYISKFSEEERKKIARDFVRLVYGNERYIIPEKYKERKFVIETVLYHISLTPESIGELLELASEEEAFIAGG